MLSLISKGSKNVFQQNKSQNESVHIHTCYNGIHADVIVYIFAHLHSALRTEGNMLDMNWLQAAKKLVKLITWWKV